MRQHPDPVVDRNRVGSHVRGGRGLVADALATAASIGAKTIQVFAGNPRGWARSKGDPAGDQAFRAACDEATMRVFVRAPYLVNLGSPTPATYLRSVASVAHNLVRARAIGVRGSFRDRNHQIGAAHIGTDAFAELFAHPATSGAPFVAETPVSGVAGGDCLPLRKKLRAG